MSKPSGTDQSSRSRRARPSFTAALVWLLAVLVAAGLFGFWPARRNYYFKRSPAPRQLDVPYQSGVSDPKQSSTYIYQAAGCLSPMVVFVHGGYSRALDRRWLEPVLGTFGNIGVSLAERGVGAAIIGYRQYPSIQHAEDSLTDIAAAIRFVRDSCPARFVELPGLGHNQIMIGIGMDDDPIVPLFRVHALNACARRPNRPEGTAVRADARPMRPPGRRRRLVLTRKTRNCAEAV